MGRRRRALVTAMGGQTVDSAIMTLMNTYGGVDWALQETSGTAVAARNTALAEGRNICEYGDFSAATGWTAGTGWAIGSGVATHTAGNTADLERTIPIRAGASYKLVFTMTVTAGSLTPKIGGQSGAARSTANTFTETIVAGSSNSLLEFTPSNDFAGTVDNVAVTWLNITANNANFNGTHTDVTVGQSAGKLGVAASYAAASSRTNIYSLELNSFFSHAAGTLFIFGQVSAAGVWTDGVGRQLFTLYVDSSNRIYIYKNATNQLAGLVAEGGTAKVTPINVTPTGFFFAALTWNMSLDTAQFYYNGVAQGSAMTGFGTWAGNLNAIYSNIGCFGASNSPWSGLLTRVVLLRSAATAAEIARLARLAGAA